MCYLWGTTFPTTVRAEAGPLLSMWPTVTLLCSLPERRISCTSICTFSTPADNGHPSGFQPDWEGHFLTIARETTTTTTGGRVYAAQLDDSVPATEQEVEGIVLVSSIRS